MRRAHLSLAISVFLFLLASPDAQARDLEETKGQNLGEGNWPPLPGADTRHALNQGEAEAGVVVLQAMTEVSGTMKQGALKMKGSMTKNFRYRYLVLDARGAERVTKYAFFGGSSQDISGIRGRTVTPDGKEHSLDPDKDVQTLDLRDANGKRVAPCRTAFFPHVEPGAVLDLAFSFTSKDLPDFEVVPLQSEFPVREAKVKVRGLIFDNSGVKAFFMQLKPVKVHWVPFLIGEVPPRAHATLDGEFNLDFTVSDIPAAQEQPYAPPSYRTAYALGLLPRFISLNKAAGDVDWGRDLFLFGTADAGTVQEGRRIISRDLDTARGMIQMDDWGLQAPPAWKAEYELMKWYQDALKRDHTRLDKFFRRTGEGESDQEVAAIAPPDLPWRERVHRLFDHVRSRVRPDLEAEQQKNLSHLLDYGKGDWRDLTLYLDYLLEKAHIPSRIVVAINRFRIPFQPIVESFSAFGTAFVVEAGPPGEVPLYLMPGNPFGDFETFPDHYLGGLAFRQPESVEGDWPLVQISRTLPLREKTQVAFASPLDPQREELELAMTSSLFDTAANYFRWRLGWEGSNTDKEALRDRRQKAIESWVDRWTNLEFKGTPPQLDPRQDVEKPLVFELKVAWKPDIQKMGDRVLIPALPNADLFRNVFKSTTRSVPIWLDGGQYEVSMTWRLPAGASVEQLPEPSEAKGPGGLSFKMDVSCPSSGEGQTCAELKTTVRVDEPYMLPATEYAGVKAFYENLQRSADTRLLVVTKAVP